MTNHPYGGLPDHAFWRRAVAKLSPSEIDPIAGEFMKLDRTDRVATAGSCFAQHIARHLKTSGFNFMVTESPHPLVPRAAAERFGYGIFTARYGNIYTALQLLQLFDRAYGRFVPNEDVWDGDKSGSAVDPFRPTIQPGGFASADELRADRRQHLARVREMFETVDVFIFTLGLTESWLSRSDGAALPLCPGVSGGRFDVDQYEFRNFRTAEVRSHLAEFIGRLAGVNPDARIIVTVSPVPLAATASGNHVLPATIYSKSVLRAAAQEIAEDFPHVHYFPSYEIITGPQSRGRYLADDLRNVTEEGVAHVMSVFLRHSAGTEMRLGPNSTQAGDDEFVEQVKQWVEAMCDEAMLDRSSE